MTLRPSYNLSRVPSKISQAAQQLCCLSPPNCDSACLQSAHGSPPPEQPEERAQPHLSTGKRGPCLAWPQRSQSPSQRRAGASERGGRASSRLSLPERAGRNALHAGSRPHTAQQRPGISSPLSKAKFRPSVEVFLQIILLLGRARG